MVTSINEIRANHVTTDELRSYLVYVETLIAHNGTDEKLEEMRDYFENEIEVHEQIFELVDGLVADGEVSDFFGEDTFDAIADREELLEQGEL